MKRHASSTPTPCFHLRALRAPLELSLHAFLVLAPLGLVIGLAHTALFADEGALTASTPPANPTSIDANTRPIKLVISPSDPSLQKFDGKWEINYRHYIRLRFTPASDMEYLFHVASDDSRVGFAVTDSNHAVLAVGSELPTRKYKRTAKVPLQEGQSCFILVGTAGIKTNAKVRAWVSTDPNAAMPPDADRAIAQVKAARHYRREYGQEIRDCT